MFGVFDGHGGAEVAKFCQRYMAQELQKLEGFGGDAVEEALVDVFHRMDEMLRDHSFADEIEQLKAHEPGEDEPGDGGGDEGGSPMDALEMIKRVFQLKRFVGDGGGGQEGGALGGGGARRADDAGGGDEAVAMEAEGGAEGSDAQQQAAAERGAGGGVGAGASGPPQQQQQPPPAQQQQQRFVEPADTRIQAGCTAVVAVIKAGHLYVANAGDSRGVLCRGGSAVAMSEDHKPAQETERRRILNAGAVGAMRCAAAAWSGTGVWGTGTEG
jgi:protein phosphatase 1G